MLNLPLFSSRNSRSLQPRPIQPSTATNVPQSSVNHLPAIPQLNHITTDTVRFGQVKKITEQEAKKTAEKWAKKMSAAPTTPFAKGCQEEVSHIIHIVNKEFPSHNIDLHYDYYADQVEERCLGVKTKTNQALCVVSSDQVNNAKKSDSSAQTATIESFVRAPKSVKGSANEVLAQVAQLLKSQGIAKVYMNTFEQEKLTTHFRKQGYKESSIPDKGNLEKEL